MAKYCVAVSVLERDYPDFVQECEKRWEKLQAKRGASLNDLQVANKKQKALDEGGSSFFNLGEQEGGPNSKTTAINWAMLPAEKKAAKREEVQSAWDLAFIVCGIPFCAADNPAFRNAVRVTRDCLDFKLACTKTLSTTRLDKQNGIANEFKAKRMRAGMKFGFLITSDGWRSAAKRNYHNYIIISVEGPIYLQLDEVTGQGGTGEDVKDGFKRIFDHLGEDVVKRVLIGVTDTPSANQKAWRLLEAAYPHQFWLGCGAHEISLLFKEWVKKVPQILILFKEGLRVVKWVNNHAEILKLFRRLVKDHFTDKRKHDLSLYMPGETRMMTVFKMLLRILVLWDPLASLCSSADYDTASQKALKAWSDRQEPDNKLTIVNGRYIDRVKHSFTSQDFKMKINGFITATKSVVYLKSLVDGQTPVLGKFYYCCALVDKHLRVLQEENQVPYVDDMRKIFSKRWKRWHRPIHTFAYALDPCYQQHELTREERKDCVQVLKKMGGGDWPKVKVEFDRWRDAGDSIFPSEVWEAADAYHAYQWWSSFGDDFTFLQPIAMDVLSKAISASACEFNWSDVGHVVNKRSQRLTDDKIDKKVNVRAMNKLNKNINGKVLLGGIPKLDDYLDSLVQEAIDNSSNGGDDVADADINDDNHAESSDDEAYDVLAESEEPLYELGGACNTDLQSAIQQHLG